LHQGSLIASWLPSWLKRSLLSIEEHGYRLTVAAMSPINRVLASVLAKRVVPRAVLHVSAMVHVPYYTTRILREHGVNADYLAVGDSPWWNRADYHFRPTRWPVISVLNEMWWLWTVVARYEIVHAHFMVTLTRSGWEWPLLKRMGRRLVVHYRGCEIRDRALNERLHPEVNICQECDYRPRLCEAPINVQRRRVAAAHGDAVLVTTPDMRDFVPQARHVPFFVMRSDEVASNPRTDSGTVRIVHATNHPGIEGSRHIREAIRRLVRKGWSIEFAELNGVTHDEVLAALATADLAIGKMKMGYYANAQVESLMAGVPTITYVRPEFMTDELRESAFIFATLDTLEAVIEHYLANPAALAAKRAVARASILRLHDNAAIARTHAALYASLRAGEPSALPMDRKGMPPSR
jgi:hypothetical protein